ncbi:MAG: DUF445 family protein [Peptostreptococcaceae bacterium]
MNNFLKILILASIGGVIGYITNVIAIKLIFRPIEPVKLPIINKEFVGLIPKRRMEIAENIGKIIEDEFLSVEELIHKAVTEKDKEDILIYIKIKIQTIVDEKIGNSFLGAMGVTKMVNDFIAEHIEDELRDGIEDLSQELIEKASSRIDIKSMVEEKINALDLYKLEEIILSVVKKELKHIEVLGLVLGFLIGIVQGLVVIFL